MKNREIHLRYGCNPHQIPAKVYSRREGLPIEVLNGRPGYINLLDALNSWQLVKELKQSLNLPAAASFKHVSPAGAAVGIPLSETLRKVYLAEGLELSALSAAYARARGADRMSSFGDWIALSDKVDAQTAQLIRREVSHGIIAPGYDSEALSILSKKRKGDYVVIQIHASYEPEELESREVFGVTFEQKRNIFVAGPECLQNLVTRERELSEAAKRDLLVAYVALKYTQSNSVCFAYDGQVIGMGAGQQSRIHCTRLAGDKADKWFLRQHPAVLKMRIPKGVGRPERDNAIDRFLLGDLTPVEQKRWEQVFEEVPRRLSARDREEWLREMGEISLGSDGYIPFRDNIDRAHQSGVKYVIQPGGSLRDSEVIQACDEYGMVMALCGVRLFHH
jgi:phosphoribosylaminoimidazolecarboxamide formyltransferase/IMP cyclohydrolase